MIRRLLVGCAIVAVVATAGSLYFSEISGLVPCGLCWYQRILMYPLVVILGVAAYDAHAGVWKTGLPLSILGIAVSAYHSAIQLSGDPTCTVGGGSTSILWRGFGIFTIPRLALVAFLLITTGLLAVSRLDRTST